MMTSRQLSTIVLALALLVSAGAADAQNRDERWEFSIGTFYQLSTSPEFETGTIDTGNDFGFVTDFGYNFNDKLAVDFGLQYAGVGYDAVGVDEDGNDFNISGNYDTWNFFGNMIYHFSDGPFTPYIGGGIGYTWVDTNVPSGPPTTGCWWDPWWGYVCSTNYPTETSSAFSYQALIGLRYEFNYTTFLKFNYTSQWMDFSNAKGTPRFDVFMLEIGWMF